MSTDASAISAALRFDLTPDAIRSTGERIAREFTCALDAIAARGPSQSFGETFGALAAAEAQAAHWSVTAALPSLVSPDRETRAVASQVKDELRTVFASAFRRADLARCFAEPSPAESSLDAEDRRYAADTLTRFALAGASIDDAAARARVAALAAELAAVESAFERTLNEDTTSVSLTPAELDGCAPAFIGALAADPARAGAVLVELKAPHTGPVLARAVADATRRTVHLAAARKCMDANGPRLEQMRELRDELARALGFDSHAHAALALTMTLRPDAATALLERTARALAPALRDDLAAMAALKASSLASTEPLAPWDVALLLDRRRLAEFAVDDEAVREFFPLDHVLPAIFDVYRELFALEFVPVPAAHVWHEEVRAYDVRDTAQPTGAVTVGRIYLDLHPRPGKYGHQCVFPVEPSYAGSRPAAAILGNMTRPTADAPALLRFAEVVTLFHELGHVLHCVCTRARYARLGWGWSVVPYAAGVEMDALEVPSQMLESFVYTPELLRRISRHYRTGAPLADALIDALCRSRDLAAGYAYTRLAAFSLVDQRMHGPGPRVPVPELQARVFAELGLPAPAPATNWAASWSHQVQGYDARYFVYLAAELVAQDCFSLFERAPGGVLDRELGLRFRRLVLERGATVPASTYFREFLGREPSPAAFLARFGLGVEQ